MELQADRVNPSPRSKAVGSRLEPLLYEAGTLLSLVDFVDSYIREQLGVHRYPPATLRFLKEIVLKKTEETRAEVQATVAAAERKPSWIENVYRPALAIYGGNWATIHSYVKPATDAHSLTTPDPLLRFASAEVERVLQADIVVLLTSEFMYFQKALRDPAAGLDPVFPPNRGFIELPYSQGTGFFLNLNIFHELGHFLYQLRSSEDHPIISSLNATMSQVLKAEPRLSRLPPEDMASVNDIIEVWTEELFCDLFAIRLIGPAFTFALIDFLWLAGLMQGGTEKEFNAEHPAPALRLKQHVLQLQRDGWWAGLQATRLQHVRLMQQLSRESDYVFNIDYDPPVQKAVGTAFLSLLKPIRDSVASLTSHIRLREHARDFETHRRHIQTCLSNGIVPSATALGSNRPGPIATINASYLFVLERLPRLMSKLSDVKRTSATDRAKCYRMVEAWTMKALEDLQFPRGAQPRRTQT